MLSWRHHTTTNRMVLVTPGQFGGPILRTHEGRHPFAYIGAAPVSVCTSPRPWVWTATNDKSSPGRIQEVLCLLAVTEMSRRWDQRGEPFWAVPRPTTPAWKLPRLHITANDPPCLVVACTGVDYRSLDEAESQEDCRCSVGLRRNGGDGPCPRALNPGLQAIEVEINDRGCK
jgi:hypothetical protein